MKTILYNAISLDGFIATLSGDSDWVLDNEEFEAFVGKTGCILIGRRTYEQYKAEAYPLVGVGNFVYTKHPEKLQSEVTKELKFLDGSPNEVLEKISNQGFQSVMLGGGGATNASFADAGLIDEMILDIHPLLLGQGIRLLDSYAKPLNLQLITSQTNLKGFVQNHYKVLQ